MSDDHDQNDESADEHTDGTLSISRRNAMKGGAAGLGLLALGGLGTGSAAASNGADKIYTGGSTFDVLSADSNDGNGTTSGVLMEGSIKTSNPTDLILLAQVESSLYTDLKVKGNDEESQARAGLDCWVEIDGVTVPVSYDYTDPASTLDREDASRVTLNYRDFYMKSTFLGDLESMTEEEEFLNTYIETKSTHGFNWVAFDIGSGDYDSSTNVHSVKLMGEVDVYADDSNAQAKAAVGKRTLIGIPAKLANDATI